MGRWLGCLLLAGLGGVAATAHAAGFELVALGVNGGLEDGNLSSYLIRADDAPRYLALDAGSVLPGIRAALRQGALAGGRGASGEAAVGEVFRQRIGAYFISHAHLDHVAGLLIAATDDTGRKPIYGLAGTLDALSRNYFNWSAWPNFADRGEAPALGRYALTAEAPGQPFAIAGTALEGTVYPLAHDRVTSSMLLLRDGADYFAYFGDTGPDAVQHSDRLAAIWQVLGPLVRRHALRGLLIETSYPNGLPDSRLYGHLTPAWLLRELKRLEAASGGVGSLRGLDVVIGHIKPSLEPGRDPRALIAEQLAAGNTPGVHFVLPRQGERLRLAAP
ncbi:MBL fold metallo-hydrolase [Frateuria defendens]|uniref:MBL fold metallo-hydrolase n=1 Tax=Frateuria defendens TaxID=2219559 RepID=UPI00066FDFA6|nr:3',5'-cyclic-nucleotide phosphodiesterase [Frateuria defendens]